MLVVRGGAYVDVPQGDKRAHQRVSTNPPAASDRPSRTWAEILVVAAAEAKVDAVVVVQHGGDAVKAEAVKPAAGQGQEQGKGQGRASTFVVRKKKIGEKAGQSIV
jgi:hypothetical protein